jgi:hypothetical protein
MGGGGTTTSGGGSGSSTTNPNLYSWKEILPPWVQTGQQTVLPWLMNRAAEGGMTPIEERNLWGQAKTTIEDSSQGASQNLSRQLAMSGLNPSSPVAGGAYADLAMDKVSQTSKAALDFAKMKMGARDTAIGQLLTALYTPAPAAVGSTTVQTQTTNPTTQPSGGK